MAHSRLIILTAICAAALVAPASALASGWVYTESNNPQSGKNAVLALDYGASGATNPARIREFRTRGTGAPLILPDKSVGTLGADQQITMSADRRWLFAVNQGSGTVAVFRVNKATGNLTHVPGSPFDSGGRNPISVGFNGRFLVVTNHAVIAPFVPGPGANFGMPNHTSFRVSRTGKLTRISTISSGPGPTQSHIPASGRNVFSTNFYAFNPPPGIGTIESIRLSQTGKLTMAPGSPTQFPASMTAGLPPLPPFLPPGLDRLAFGIISHPTRPYIYVLGPANQRVAIYRYAANGALTFVGQVDHPGFAACWLAITSDGRYLYSANSVTQDISLFRVSPSGSALRYVEVVKLPSTGTVSNLAIDEDDKYLYALGAHDDPDGPRPQAVAPDGTIGSAPADGNFLEAYRIGGDGKLRPISTTALPIRLSQWPYGLASVERDRPRLAVRRRSVSLPAG